MREVFNIYIAAPLFSQADREFNEKVANQIQEAFPGCSIYLPQRNPEINDKTKSASSYEIYEADTLQLSKSDILVALLDGSTIDEGVASEIGWAAGYNHFSKQYKSPLEIKIFGLFTDCRDFSRTRSEEKIRDSSSGLAENQFVYRNLYSIGACKTYGGIYNSIENLIRAIRKVF